MLRVLSLTAFVAVIFATADVAFADIKECKSPGAPYDECYVWVPDIGWIDYCGEVICIEGDVPEPEITCPPGMIPAPFGGCRDPYEGEPGGGGVEPDDQGGGGGGSGGGAPTWTYDDFGKCEKHAQPCDCCNRTSLHFNQALGEGGAHCRDWALEFAWQQCKAGNFVDQFRKPVPQKVVLYTCEGEDILISAFSGCHKIFTEVDNINYSPCSEAWFWGVPDVSITLSGELAFTVLKDVWEISLSASEVTNWPSQYSGLNSFCNSLITKAASVRAAEFMACAAKNKCKAEMTADQLTTVDNPGFQEFVKKAALPSPAVNEMREVLNQARMQLRRSVEFQASTRVRERAILDNLVARPSSRVYPIPAQSSAKKGAAKPATMTVQPPAPASAGPVPKQPLGPVAGAVWASQIRDRHAGDRILQQLRARELERETLDRLKEILKPEDYSELLHYWPLIVIWIHGLEPSQKR